MPLLKKAAASGRSFHREWVERVLGPSLPAELTGRALRLAELVAVTDVLVRKLLRLDGGLTAAQTETAILHLVGAVARGEPR